MLLFFIDRSQQGSQMKNVGRLQLQGSEGSAVFRVRGFIGFQKTDPQELQCNNGGANARYSACVL